MTAGAPVRANHAGSPTGTWTDMKSAGTAVQLIADPPNAIHGILTVEFPVPAPAKGVEVTSLYGVATDAGRILTEQLVSGRPLAIVCHAPAAMLATRIHGVSPFKGYRVTCFTNDEEEAVGLASRTRWLLEDELKELGVEFSRGDIWKPYMVEDRNLITGQNPHSAAILADRLMQILK